MIPSEDESKTSDVMSEHVTNDQESPLEKEVHDEYLDKPKKLKKSIIDMELVHRALKKMGLVLFGFVISFIPWSFLLMLIGVLSFLWLETRGNCREKRIAAKYASISMTKDDLLKKVDELPAWVTFPDRERAEWLNEIIRQLWPSMSNYVVKIMKGSVQAKIRRKHKGFTFEEVDFGTNPPKIDGVKVYDRSATRDCIIIDFDLYYDGNCDITFSSSGTHLGKIRDFQASVEVRVVLKPILVKIPLIGGIQVYFLNTPEIHFSLEGISGIPGLSDFIRQKIEEKIRRAIVFPNKVAKRFTKSVDAAELKCLEPEGVLRVHVVRATDLEKKDFGGTSDPYVVLNVGAQEFKSQVVKKCVNPRFDYWCEFFIIDPLTQVLYFKLFDHDELNEDDFLGSGSVEICEILKNVGTDRVLNLQKVKHGAIHLRFTWLGLTEDKVALLSAYNEYRMLKVDTISTAALMIYIDCAQSLPRLKDFKKPDPYMLLSVGKHQEKSKVKRHTDDPVWEQGFVLLVTNPDYDSLQIKIMDKSTGVELDELTYQIKNLFEMPNLQISKQDFALKNNPPASKIIISLQLRILTNAKFENEDSDSSASDSEIPRPNSCNATKSEISANSSPASTPSLPEDTKDGSPPPAGEPLIAKTSIRKSARSPSIRKRFLQHSFSNHSSINESRPVGKIDLTFEYNEMRQRLIITVNRVMNLPLKDPDHIPDPYVTLKLTPCSHSIKYKTKAYIDTCDPVFDETFEYLLSREELAEQKLIAVVKTKKFFSYKNHIGQVIIKLDSIDWKEQFRACYDLFAESD